MRAVESCAWPDAITAAARSLKQMPTGGASSRAGFLDGRRRSGPPGYCVHNAYNFPARCPPVTTAAVPARRGPNTTLGILAIAAISYVLQQTLVVPALPNIQRELHTTTTWTAWVFTGFLLTSAIFTPIVGKLGDMFGKKRMLVVAMGVFALGTVVAALASSIGMLIAGRAVQGVGGAIIPLAFGIIRDELPRERVGAGMGLLSATFGVGGGVGLVCSGLVLAHWSWPMLFWLGSIPLLGALVLVAMIIPESPIRTPARIDWWGALTLSIGLGALMVALSEGSRWGWASATTLGVFALAIAILVLWVVVELRVREPLIDIGLMRDRSVFWTNLVALITGAAMFGTFLLVPTLVQMPRGLPDAAASLVHYGFAATVVQAGLFLLPSSIVMLLVGPIAGTLEARVGARRLLAAGLAVLSLGALAIALWHSSRLGVVVAMALVGGGVGSSYAMLAKLIVDSVPQAVTGVTMGMNTVMRTIGGVVGGQVGAAVLSSFTIAGTAIPAEGGFTTMFVISAAISALAAVLTLRIPRQPQHRSRVVSVHPSAATAETAAR